VAHDHCYRRGQGGRNKQQDRNQRSDIERSEQLVRLHRATRILRRPRFRTVPGVLDGQVRCAVVLQQHIV